MLMAECRREPRPRGRPQKPDAERLSEVLNFRVTAHEADAVYQYAIRHGAPLNTVLRSLLQRFLTISVSQKR